MDQLDCMFWSLCPWGELGFEETSRRVRSLDEMEDDWSPSSYWLLKPLFRWLLYAVLYGKRKERKTEANEVADREVEGPAAKHTHEQGRSGASKSGHIKHSKGFMWNEYTFFESVKVCEELHSKLPSKWKSTEKERSECSLLTQPEKRIDKMLQNVPAVARLIVQHDRAHYTTTRQLQSTGSGYPRKPSRRPCLGNW